MGFPINASQGETESVITLLITGFIFLSPLLLILVAWIIGTIHERNHYASIRKREAETAHLPAVSVRQLPSGWQVGQARLVSGHVVIAIDRFKRMLAMLRRVFGGRVRAYESLVDRARREAVLRMKESCPNAELILNLRIETSNISQTNGDRGTGAVEVLAYGTAIQQAKAPPPLPNLIL